MRLVRLWRWAVDEKRAAQNWSAVAGSAVVGRIGSCSQSEGMAQTPGNCPALGKCPAQHPEQRREGQPLLHPAFLLPGVQAAREARSPGPVSYRARKTRQSTAISINGRQGYEKL